jgi:hypothetical protein
MFFPRTSPLSLDESGLHSLWVALNTPILSVLELPPGPAMACIAIHAEKGGRRALTIAIRALRGGEVAFFTLDEDLSQDGAVPGAIDGALSFAEAMGFLFDDELDTATAAQRKQALARWRELVGETKKGSAKAPAPAEELVLDEAVELEETEPRVPPPRRGESPAKAAAPPASKASPAKTASPASKASPAKTAGPPGSRASSAPAGTAPSAGVSLTKFRKRSGATAPRENEEGASDAARAAQAARKAVLMTPHGPALGRLQLIKRQRSVDAAPAGNWLARLLGSF